MSATTWNKRRPSDVGWYWFVANEDSPKSMARDEPCVVYVGCNEDENVYGFKFAGASFLVKEVKGYFAGPLQEPEFN